MNTLLEIRDLHAFYGKSHVLHGVSLHVQQGEIVSLLGKPDECSGLTVPILSAEKCNWKSGEHQISVSFVNDAAITASATGL